MNDLLPQSVPATATTPSNVLVIESGNVNPEHEYTEIRMQGGQVFRVPTELLTANTAAFAQSEEARADLPFSYEPPAGSTSETVIVPVIEENLVVSKRTVPTATVQLQKTVEPFEQTVDELLAMQTFEIERVPLNQAVETAPLIRQEGETTIYPLVEEQLVFTRQLVLKEEVRVTRRQTERRETQVVTLRRDRLDVVRTPVEQE